MPLSSVGRIPSGSGHRFPRHRHHVLLVVVQLLDHRQDQTPHRKDQRQKRGHEQPQRLRVQVGSILHRLQRPDLPRSRRVGLRRNLPEIRLGHDLHAAIGHLHRLLLLHRRKHLRRLRTRAGGGPRSLLESRRRHDNGVAVHHGLVLHSRLGRPDSRHGGGDGLALLGVWGVGLRHRVAVGRETDGTVGSGVEVGSVGSLRHFVFVRGDLSHFADRVGDEGAEEV
mmetsp:Transcript_16285/g.32319  ORF Transcript_16285/g.32319 Transcript_16285/m.32319 type:complete len:225 (+) Transcript_16285:380-1054(+)